MSDGFPPKSEWAPGPWHDEPDALDWRDDRTGLSCAIRRNAAGAWCGYVGVPPGHSFFGWHHNDDISLRPEFLQGDVDRDYGAFDIFLYAASGGPKHGTIPLGMGLHVHGGVNWSGKFPGSDHANGDRFWWFGFDCSHADDVSPALDALFNMTRIGRRALNWSRAMQTYRALDYVKAEVTRLAFQLRQLEAAVDLTAMQVHPCGDANS